MTTSQPIGLIGVDGGGTTCRFALRVHGQRFERRMGAANVTTDRDGAIATLRAGLAALAEEAGLSAAALRTCPAHLGLAGVIGPDDADAVARALPLDDPVVTDDRMTSATGALGGADGALAGIGTGSFLAASIGGEMRFAGGWGLILGDEASGAWLGRGLLAETLRILDGLAAPSALSAVVLSEHGGPAGIVAAARANGPAGFAARAPQIVAAATAGDAVAAGLMAEGAAYIVSGLAALGWRPDLPFCLTGGVGPAYAPYLPPRIAARITPPRGSALDGALTLAARRAQAPAP